MNEEIRIALDGILQACEAVKVATDARLAAAEVRIARLELDAEFIPSPSNLGSEI